MYLEFRLSGEHCSAEPQASSAQWPPMHTSQPLHFNLLDATLLENDLVLLELL